MSSVQAEIIIDAPIERVWETIMDPERLADWVTIHKSVAKASPTPLSEGATMHQTMQVRGLTFKVHWELISVDAPHQAQWEGGGPARSTAMIRYQLSSQEDGQTLFRYSNEFKPPGGRLGSVAGRVIVGATSQREANNSLSRLKTMLENAR